MYDQGILVRQVLGMFGSELKQMCRQRYKEIFLYLQKWKNNDNVNKLEVLAITEQVLTIQKILTDPTPLLNMYGNSYKRVGPDNLGAELRLVKLNTLISLFQCNQGRLQQS